METSTRQPLGLRFATIDGRSSNNSSRIRDSSHEEHPLPAQNDRRRATGEDEQLLLHQTVMASKKQQIALQLERLAKQRAFIRHEKRKLLLQNALLESERERFEASLSSDWFCSNAFSSAHDRRLTIDVGGQLFEISSALAAKDSGSLLAAFVDEDSPLSVTERGCFRIDRDWWLFRYVLAFLRDGILPQEPKLLRELYLESEFWKLESLRRAIEMRNMELLQMKQESDGAAATLLSASLGSRVPAAMKGGSSSVLARLKGEATAADHAPARAAKDASAWWLEPPVWWGKGDKSETAKKGDIKPPAKVSAFASLLKKKAKSEAEAAVSDQDAWWKSATYKGVDFAQGLSLEKKAQATGGGRHEDSAATYGASTPRIPLVVNSTWSSSHHLSQ